MIINVVDATRNARLIGFIIFYTCSFGRKVSTAAVDFLFTPAPCCITLECKNKQRYNTNSQMPIVVMKHTEQG